MLFRSGKPIRTLVLQDSNGCQVAIKQLGHGAEDASIKPLHEVMVYFASGSKAWKSGEMGSLWAYDDSLIKLGSTVTSIPRAIKDVVILAE